MSEIEKFMGKTEAKAKAAEPAASADQVMDIATKAVAAYIAAQAKAPKLSPEADADINRMANAAPNIDMNDRVWIILSDNKNIPRGGQYIGCNGASFLLKTGRKAHVPRGVLDILDNAIEGVAIVDPDTLQIAEYRQVMRYPYQVVSAP